MNQAGESDSSIYTVLLIKRHLVPTSQKHTG